MVTRYTGRWEANMANGQAREDEISHSSQLSVCLVTKITTLLRRNKDLEIDELEFRDLTDGGRNQAL